MKSLKMTALLIAALGLTACAKPDTAMRNSPYITKEAAEAEAPVPIKELQQTVSVVGMSINVPRSLEVSEKNRYYPSGDIVWREDPIGDRYEQVESILREAAQKAIPNMTGERETILNIQLHRFHALTEKARYTVGGVHNIEFTWALTDASSGELLTQPKFVHANLDALGGAAAVAAENRGITQRFRIVHHLADVLIKEVTTDTGWRHAGHGFYDLVNEL